MTTQLSARTARQQNETIIDLGDGTHVRARKEDLTVLVFEGRVPMPLLAAVQQMIDLPNATPMQRVEALGAQNGQSLVELLREHVCKVCIDPVVVPVDDGDPDHLPVSYFSVPQMMTIWTRTAVVPRVTPLEAATFRPETVLDAPVAPSNGGALQPPAEPLDSEREIEKLVTM